MLEAAASQGEGGMVRVGEEPPFEDPIPGAANWTLAEISQALVDFRELMTKVERLTEVYTQKYQVGLCSCHYLLCQEGCQIGSECVCYIS